MSARVRLLERGRIDKTDPNDAPFGDDRGVAQCPAALAKVVRAFGR